MKNGRDIHIYATVTELACKSPVDLEHTVRKLQALYAEVQHLPGLSTLYVIKLQAIAEALILGEKSGLERAQLIEVLKQTAVISPRQKAALENAAQREYPANFPLPLMFKDFGLILRQASELAVPMPATAATQQAYAIAETKGIEEDVAAIIRVMEELAGVSAG